MRMMSLRMTRSEGDQRPFSCRQQSLVEEFEDAIMFDGTQGGHVEGAADGAPAAADTAHAFELAAVPVEGCDASQGGGGGGGELAQFGHFRQHGGDDDRSHARNGIQAFGFMSQVRIGGDEFQDGLVALFDLFIQDFTELAGLADTQRVGVMLGAVVFGGEAEDELAAALADIRQALLLGGQRRSGRRLKGLAVMGQDGGVDGIGFGALTLGAREVTDSCGFDDADRDAGGLEDANHGQFITAGGLADQMGRGMGSEEFKESGHGLWGHWPG